MVRHERLRYLCEMAAALGAVGVFVAVYLIAYMQFGATATLLAAWLPAAVLAWLAARALRAALHRMLDLAPPRAAARAPVDDIEVETLRVPTRSRSSVRTR